MTNDSLPLPLDGWLRDIQPLEDGSIYLAMDVRDADLEMALELGFECDVMPYGR